MLTDYDLNREDFSDLAPFLAMDMLEKPKKVQIFKAALKKSILDSTLTRAADLFRFCLTHAMLPKHAVASAFGAQGPKQDRLRLPLTAP